MCPETNVWTAYILDIHAWMHTALDVQLGAQSSPVQPQKLSDSLQAADCMACTLKPQLNIRASCIGILRAEKEKIGHT